MQVCIKLCDLSLSRAMIAKPCPVPDIEDRKFGLVLNVENPCNR